MGWCLDLTDYRHRGPGPKDRRSSIPSDLIPRPRGAVLIVHRMRIGSPMEITFVVEGGGELVAAYAALLFVRALRSPEDVGSWLPRLVAAWHREWSEAKREKLTRRTRGRTVPNADQLPIPEQVRPVRELTDVGAEMVRLRMKPDEVVTVGLDESSGELADLDDS